MFMMDWSIRTWGAGRGGRERALGQSRGGDQALQGNEEKRDEGLGRARQGPAALSGHTGGVGWGKGIWLGILCQSYWLRPKASVRAPGCIPRSHVEGQGGRSPGVSGLGQGELTWKVPTFECFRESFILRRDSRGAVKAGPKEGAVPTLRWPCGSCSLQPRVIPSTPGPHPWNLPTSPIPGAQKRSSPQPPPTQRWLRSGHRARKAPRAPPRTCPPAGSRLCVRSSG